MQVQLALATLTVEFVKQPCELYGFFVNILLLYNVSAQCKCIHCPKKKQSLYILYKVYIRSLWMDAAAQYMWAFFVYTRPRLRPFLFTPGPGSGLFCLHQAQAQVQEPNINRNRCVGSSLDRVGFYAEIQINIGTVYCKIGGSDIVLLRCSKQGIWLPIRFIFTSFFQFQKSWRFSFKKITWA